MLKDHPAAALQLDNLFVSDLDQTLLYNDATLSDFSRKQLNQMLAKGLPFTVATGRSYYALKPVVEGLDLQLPVVELNGAFLSDLATGQHLHTQSIAPDTVGSLVESLEQQHFFLLSTDEQADHLYFSPPEHEGQSWYIQDRKNDPRCSETRDPRLHLDEAVVGLTIIEREACLLELEQELQRHYAKELSWVIFENQYQPGWFWMTIHDKGATKAEGLKRLMDYYALCPSGLTVYGDHLNDISMFHYAGDAVAVENAVPELKALANRIIGCNENDSVARDLQEQWHR